MTDTCGLTSCEPFAKWDHDSQCWKTSEVTSLWALTLSSLTLPQWGGLHNGELCEHPTPAPVTSGHDCSSLPTPTKGDGEGGGKRVGVTWADTTKSTGNGGASRLRDVAGLLSTYLPIPTVDDSSNVTRASGCYNSLTRTATALLPTPAVNDMGEGKTLEWWDDWAPRQKAADGRPAPHGRSLAIEAQRMLPTPSAADAMGGHLTHSGDRSDELLLPGLVKTFLPTPTSQAAKRGELSPVKREGNRPQDRGNLWVVMPRLVGETTPQPSFDGSASSDDPHQHQLSLDVLALPA